MSTETKSAKSTTAKRPVGRPSTPLVLPKSASMTISAIMAANPTIKARLTVYTKVGELVKEKKLFLTGQTEPKKGPGRPAEIYGTAAYMERLAKAKAKTPVKAKAKAPAKAKAKAPAPLATVPTVDITPAVEAPAPTVESPVETPVTA